MVNRTDNYLQRIPTELWVDHILPQAVGPGFLPGMLGASRRTRALALETHVRVMHDEAKASPPLRAPHLPRPPMPLKSLPFPELLAFARQYEQRLRTQGGPTEREMMRAAIENHTEELIGTSAEIVDKLQNIRDLFTNRVPTLNLSYVDLHRVPANLAGQPQLRSLNLTGNYLSGTLAVPPLPNLEILLMHHRWSRNARPIALTTLSEHSALLPRLRLFSFDVEQEELVGNWAESRVPVGCPNLQFVHLEVAMQHLSVEPAVKEAWLPASNPGEDVRRLVLMRFATEGTRAQYLTFAVVRNSGTSAAPWSEQQNEHLSQLLKENKVPEGWLGTDG